ncbi:MAG: tetratricopeptide repeat protein [Sulfurovum sp.]|nr:tetratricopeptide repeat protein [Sulfurovum sp.]
MPKIIIMMFVLSMGWVQAFDKIQAIAGCKEDNITVCYALATHLTTGANGENQETMKEGLGYMRKACVYGEKKACDKLGENYLKNKSYGAARPYLVDACNRGIKTACEAVGTIFRDGHDIRQNDVKAREFYTKACDLQSGDACHNVAIMYRGGFGVTKSREQEKRFYQKGCDLGLVVGCERFTDLDNEDKGIETGLWVDIKAWWK